MTEKPIIFSAPMVCAILEGRKTQTRRVIKPQPEFPLRSMRNVLTDGIAWCHDLQSSVKRGDLEYADGSVRPLSVTTVRSWNCPYGQAKDHLWVRETWCDPEDNQDCVYRADLSAGELKDEADVMRVTAKQRGPYYRPWRPSIFMPRWASRITLEITEVRVQRVQQLTRADALAEGIPDAGYDKVSEAYLTVHQPVCDYAHLWDSINAKRGFSWESNPWVWVVTFKRLER